jgi:hypothetical protein
MRLIALALGLALGATSALAKDTDPCASGMVCASSPKTLAGVMQDEGFKAKIGEGSDGDPTIESAANGYTYVIYFYGCEKGANCDSIQFNASFSAEDDNTPAYANDWNANKRFIQASVTDKKGLELRYDLSTVGGLNKKNFADVVDWWHSMLSEFSDFVASKKKK